MLTLQLCLEESLGDNSNTQLHVLHFLLQLCQCRIQLAQRTDIGHRVVTIADGVLDIFNRVGLILQLLRQFSDLLLKLILRLLQRIELCLWAAKLAAHVLELHGDAALIAANAIGCLTKAAPICTHNF